jgi:hypothetical protein
MLTFRSRQSYSFCDGVSRRDFLKIGTLGLGGLTLGDWLRLQAQGAGRARARSVIMVYLPGGPSHIDTYDMKPDAPAEIRGEFRPIRTNVPGLDVCELMPLQAQIANRLAIVRGLKVISESHIGYELMTGDPVPPGGKFDTIGPRGRPSIGAVVSRVRGPGGALPSYVSLRGFPMHVARDEDPAYLGAACAPFVPAQFEPPPPEGRKRRDRGQDNPPPAQPLRLADGVTLDRLANRNALLQSFDTLRQELDGEAELAALDAYRAQALDLITSEKTRAALDVSREPEHVRAKYGQPLPLKGASYKSDFYDPMKFLLARRLVEAGVSFVTVGFGEWDTHGSNFKQLRAQLPVLDRAIHALVTDLHERGLEKDVAVVVWGEMGRTPKINNSDAGRDHWPEAGCVLVAGGGLRMGQVVGATDRKAERARGKPYTPRNVLATLYHVLGIDTELTFRDFSGRPMYLLDDREPIAELLG